MCRYTTRYTMQPAQCRYSLLLPPPGYTALSLFLVYTAGDPLLVDNRLVDGAGMTAEWTRLRSLIPVLRNLTWRTKP